MNYLQYLNQDKIDKWNKENPEETFSYEDCAKGLEECVDSAVESVIDSVLEKYSEGKYYIEPEYLSEISSAVNNTDAISMDDFSSIVLSRVESFKVIHREVYRTRT